MDDDLDIDVEDAKARLANPDIPPGDFKMPTMEEMIQMLDKLQDLSDEERESLKKDLLGRASNKMSTIPTTSNDYIIFSIMVALIAFVFVFFGYKLYISLTEKERKREEKQKAKQMKKKK